MDPFVFIHFSWKRGEIKECSMILNINDIARIMTIPDDHQLVLKTNPYNNFYYIDEKTKDHLMDILLKKIGE